MDELTNDERKLLERYAECRMRVSAVAKETHYDRRTIYRRLSSLKAKTGIDPFTFYGLCQLLGVIEW